MEQIFMIEVFVEKLVLKIDPPVKDEEELKLAEEARIVREKAESEAAALAAKKNKGKGAKGKGKGKGKGVKEPPQPSPEELKFLKTCTVQMRCLPLFDFNIAHDNFIAPPPSTSPVTAGKKGKGAAKKDKKGKKGKKSAGPELKKIVLPSEPLPDFPYFCVGNLIVFPSRPCKLEEVMKFTPITINVWNRDADMNCVGFVIVDWDDSFFNAIDRAAELNPLRMDGQYRNTSKPEVVTVTVEMTKSLQCEEDLKLSGNITFYIRLTALGNKIVSSFVTLPEMPMIPARTYLADEDKSKDIEAITNWQGSTIQDLPPVAYLYCAPDINRSPVVPVDQTPPVYDEYVAPFTSSELNILAMGFPKGPCGGTNCPKRMENRGSDHQFIHGEFVKGKFNPGQFVNKNDIHGPCGRLDCPLARKVRSYLQKEGAFKPCMRPCPKEYY